MFHIIKVCLYFDKFVNGCKSCLWVIQCWLLYSWKFGLIIGDDKPPSRTPAERREDMVMKHWFDKISFFWNSKKLSHARVEGIEWIYEWVKANKKIDEQLIRTIWDLEENMFQLISSKSIRVGGSTMFRLWDSDKLHVTTWCFWVIADLSVGIFFVEVWK